MPMHAHTYTYTSMHVHTLDVIMHTCTPLHTHIRTHRKGKLEPVRLTLAQRTGNKKVTLVDNLDSYLIPPAELAHTVQRIAAASSTGNHNCLMYNIE